MSRMTKCYRQNQASVQNYYRLAATDTIKEKRLSQIVQDDAGKVMMDCNFVKLAARQSYCPQLQ